MTLHLGLGEGGGINPSSSWRTVPLKKIEIHESPTFVIRTSLLFKVTGQSSSELFTTKKQSCICEPYFRSKYSMFQLHVHSIAVYSLCIRDHRVLPRKILRHSGWVWFGWSLWLHQSFRLPHQRNIDLEGMGGCSAERAWGEHWIGDIETTLYNDLCPIPTPTSKMYLNWRLVGLTCLVYVVRENTAILCATRYVWWCMYIDRATCLIRLSQCIKCMCISFFWVPAKNH